MPGVLVGEGALLKLLHSRVVGEEVMDVGSVVKTDILPGSAPQVEEETTSAGTANKRATWLMIAPSLRSAGGAERKVTRWRTVQCHRNVSTVEKKVTPLPTVQSL